MLHQFMKARNITIVTFVTSKGKILDAALFYKNWHYSVFFCDGNAVPSSSRAR